MRWITRERPKIDRVACPWLIARFVDPGAEFHFVPAADVGSRAIELDAILAKYRLDDPRLAELATIVRGADTARFDLAPECAGLLAVSLGLSRLFADDHEQLRHGFVVYDALYAWRTAAREERHDRNPRS